MSHTTHDDYAIVAMLLFTFWFLQNTQAGDNGNQWCLTPLIYLDGTGNVQHAVDFRALYATALDRWWGMDAAGILRGRHAPLDLIRV